VDIRGETVWELLIRDSADWEVVKKLLHSGRLVELEYFGHRLYLLRLRNNC